MPVAPTMTVRPARMAVAAVKRMHIHQRLKKDIKVFFSIILSSLLSSIAIRYFAQAGDLIPGGFSGLSLLIIQLVKRSLGIELSFSVLYLLFNIIPTVLVFKLVGKRFALFSVMQFTLTSFFTLILPKASAITTDILLLSVFGGIINGFASTIALRSDASTGGTDFIAIYSSMRFNTPTWNYIMGLNALILVIAGMNFGWYYALYSILYQFASMQIVKALHSRYKLVTIEIITVFPDEVCTSILSTTRHGITKFNAEGMYQHQSKAMLMMVVNAFEVDTIIHQVKAVDSKAFINIMRSVRVVGNYTQKPLE